MKIGILSHPDDLQAVTIGRALDRLEPACAIHLDLGLAPDSGLIMTGRELRLHGQDLTDLDAVLVSGFPYMDPVAPAPAQTVDWSVWNIDYVVEQQRFSTTIHRIVSVGQDYREKGCRGHSASSRRR